MSNLKKSHRIVTAPQAIACGEQPLTGLDVGMPVDSFCIALVYPLPLDELRLITSLQKALDQTPYFSGRLFGIGSTLPLAIPNNEGALFSCNTCASSMPVFGIDRPLKPYLPKIVHCISGFGFDHHTPLLQVQLTNFPDGCILGISISHALCDGASMLEFMQCWAGHALQQPSRPAPGWNRRDVQQMATGDGSAPSPQSSIVELKQPLLLNTQPVDTDVFRLPSWMLEQLFKKYRDGDEGPHHRISRQDIVVAFLYLLLLRSGNITENCRSLSIVCNIRQVLELPATYLGNAVCLRHLEPNTDSLHAMDVPTIARQVRKLQSGITAKDLRRDLAFWQRRSADGTAAQFMPIATQLALSGGILIDNMSKFVFYDLDFGSGAPIWIDTPPPTSPAPVVRGVLMLPAPPDLGGIDFHVSLPPEEMTNLRGFMKSLHTNDEPVSEINTG